VTPGGGGQARPAAAKVPDEFGYIQHRGPSIPSGGSVGGTGGGFGVSPGGGGQISYPNLGGGAVAGGGKVPGTAPGGQTEPYWTAGQDVGQRGAGPARAAGGAPQLGWSSAESGTPASNALKYASSLPQGVPNQSFGATEQTVAPSEWTPNQFAAGYMSRTNPTVSAFSDLMKGDLTGAGTSAALDLTGARQIPGVPFLANQAAGMIPAPTAGPGSTLGGNLAQKLGNLSADVSFNRQVREGEQNPFAETPPPLRQDVYNSMYGMSQDPNEMGRVLSNPPQTPTFPRGEVPQAGYRGESGISNWDASTKALGARESDPMNPDLANAEHNAFSQDVVNNYGILGRGMMAVAPPLYGAAKAIGQATGLGFNDATPASFEQIGAGMAPAFGIDAGYNQTRGDSGSLSDEVRSIGMGGGGGGQDLSMINTYDPSSQPGGGYEQSMGGQEYASPQGGFGVTGPARGNYYDPRDQKYNTGNMIQDYISGNLGFGGLIQGMNKNASNSLSFGAPTMGGITQSPTPTSSNTSSGDYTSGYVSPTYSPGAGGFTYSAPLPYNQSAFGVFK